MNGREPKVNHWLVFLLAATLGCLVGMLGGVALRYIVMLLFEM